MAKGKDCIMSYFLACSKDMMLSDIIKEFLKTLRMQSIDSPLHILPCSNIVIVVSYIPAVTVSTQFFMFHFF